MKGEVIKLLVKEWAYFPFSMRAKAVNKCRISDAVDCTGDDVVAHSSVKNLLSESDSDEH